MPAHFRAWHRRLFQIWQTTGGRYRLAGPHWRLQQTSVTRIRVDGGRQNIYWNGEINRVRDMSIAQEKKYNQDQGQKHGVRGSCIINDAKPPCYALQGSILYDKSSACLIPHHPDLCCLHLGFCKISYFDEEVRRLDQINGYKRTLEKVPFDLDHWQEVADENTPTASPTRTATTQRSGSSTGTRSRASVRCKSPSPASWATAGPPSEMRRWSCPTTPASGSSSARH